MSSHSPQSRNIYTHKDSLDHMRKKVDLTYEDERSEALISRHVRIGKDDDDNVQWRERSCHAYISS